MSDIPLPPLPDPYEIIDGEAFGQNMKIDVFDERQMRAYARAHEANFRKALEPPPDAELDELIALLRTSGRTVTLDREAADAIATLRLRCVQADRALWRAANLCARETLPPISELDTGIESAIYKVKERAEKAERELDRLANEMEYRGNSVAYIYQKKDAYGATIDRVFAALAEKGIKPDGKTPLDDLIRAALPPMPEAKYIVELLERAEKAERELAAARELLTHAGLLKAQEETVRLRQEIAALKPDAERWRFDCEKYEKAGSGGVPYWDRQWRLKVGQDEFIDAAIDAARGK